MGQGFGFCIGFVDADCGSWEASVGYSLCIADALLVAASAEGMSL